ncbi:MAG: acetyl-CoA carboxylase, carboxyltransferase subunit beta [Coriobacteriia bacterium]|nr:acetyl-CoA carboxylase, carboxyltransferase subunit beta [Coriobacteriia bacterium]
MDDDDETSPMPISDWFKAREERRDTVPAGAPQAGDVPDGVWIKCEGCKRTLYARDLDENLQVCPSCGLHMSISSDERIALLADEDSFQETETGLTSGDPLGFSSGKPYTVSLATARERTGLAEAMVTGTATIGGVPVVLGVMDFRFIAASMGSVVGERIARAFELALAQRQPLVLVTASGGARMQEGIFSLMQMAKTSAAAARLSEAGVPYISILTNPTLGGVTASFATLADVLIAEPGALIGFAGPRLVEQTIRRGLPKGFQSAESLSENGLVDMVVDRREIRERLVLLLGYLVAGGE